MTIKEAVKTLLDAISAVNPNYILVEAIPDLYIKKLQTERSFAYELYHQWRVKLDGKIVQKGCLPQKNELYINGEVSKNIDFGVHGYPDMLLHGGQGDIKNQLLACEIKRVEGGYPTVVHLRKDFAKLHKYLHLTGFGPNRGKNYGYQQAVFIMANCDDGLLRKKICEMLKNDFEGKNEILADANRITCICVAIKGEGQDRKLKVSSLLLREILDSGQNLGLNK